VLSFSCQINHNQLELKQVCSSAVVPLRIANINQRSEPKVNTHIQRTYWDKSSVGNKHVANEQTQPLVLGTVPNHKIAQSLSKQNNGKANSLHKADSGRTYIYTIEYCAVRTGQCVKMCPPPTGLRIKFLLISHTHIYHCNSLFKIVRVEMFTYSWNVPFAIINFTARLLQMDSKYPKLQTVISSTANSE
jgi:hypothetical protein